MKCPHCGKDVTGEHGAMQCQCCKHWFYGPVAEIETILKKCSSCGKCCTIYADVLRELCYFCTIPV